MNFVKKTSIVIISLILVFFLIFVALWNFYGQQLDINKIIYNSESISILDQNDVLVTNVYSKENRKNISINNLNDYTKNAFIAIEDERFYSHIGIDIKRILGATLKNIKSGKISQGASTITQQLIKLSHLTSEKTLSRKIKEAFLALKIEKEYSKNEILEMYLNFCYFGNGSYGIESASQAYFEKSANELTISQSAMLAGILKSPTKYAPHTNYENAIERRNLVLQQMYKLKYINEQEYHNALNEEIHVNTKSNNLYQYGYYIDSVLYEAEQILGDNQESLINEGCIIYTTLDTEIQNNLEKLSTTNLPKNDYGTSPEIAMISMSNTGEIKGVVGGHEYITKRGLNRVFDIKRSPGSTIKPVLVYTPAIEYNNYTTASFILDEKQNFGDYSPSNSNNKYNGWVTMRYAISKSLNVPAVKVLQDIGIENAKNYAKSVGIKFHNTDNNLALALGGFTEGITPASLCASYMPYSNDGYYTEPHTIRKITDINGNILYESNNETTQVISNDTSFLMANMLKDVITNGTANSISNLNLNIAGKTGTSSTVDGGTKDAWFVSFDAQNILTVWIGNDDGTSLSSKISGSTYPVTISGEFYKNCNYELKDFVKPSNVVEVNLDKSSLENEKKALLANEFISKENIIKEYFTLSTVPKEFSNTYNTLNEITNFEVKIKNNYPTISFDTNSSLITYKIFRDNEEIYNTMGTNSKIEYIDSKTKKNKKYEYHIVAIMGKKQIETKKIAVST